MRTTLLIALALFCIAGPAAKLASAQSEYDWAFRTREQNFGADQNTAKTTKRATTDVRTRIERVDANTLEVTIVSLKMSMPDTPMGAMEFDSAAEPDPKSMLEPALRPMVGERFTVTYDPESGLIKASGAVIELSAAKAIAPMTIDPWTATTYMPFFVGQGEEQVEGQSDKQRAFMVLPMAVARVSDGEPSPVTYTVEGVEGVRVLELKHDDAVKGITEGALSRFENSVVMFSGDGRAELDAEGVRSYAYSGTTEVRFDFKPDQPVRVLMKASFTMALAAQEANAAEPAEAESEEASGK